MEPFRHLIAKDVLDTVMTRLISVGYYGTDWDVISHVLRQETGNSPTELVELLIGKLTRIREGSVGHVARRLQNERAFAEAVLGANDPPVEADGGNPERLQNRDEGDGAAQSSTGVGDEGEGLDR